MKSSMRMGQKLLFLFLSIFLMSWFVSCAPEAKQKDDAAGGVWPQDYVGVWENIGYGSTYKISETKIIDAQMKCEFQIVDSTPVNVADNYILILTECTKGTEYTPAGNFYAIALKKIGDTLNISCPLDYSLKISSLSELKERFNSSYDPEIGVKNFVTECTPKTEASLTVYESEYYSYRVVIKPNLVTYAEEDANHNYVVDDDYSFIPKRDMSKEKGDISFYLYSESDRTYGGDLVYMAVRDTGDDTNAIYYYVYDDEEEDSIWEWIWDAEMYAEISDDDLAELKEMFP